MDRKVWRNKKMTSRVSYIRKPFAVRSIFASGLCIASLILLIIGFRQAVKTAGEIPLNYLVMCLFSIIFAVLGLYYAIRSFFEREKDYLLSKISFLFTSLEVLFWVLVLLMGL